MITTHGRAALIRRVTDILATPAVTDRFRLTGA